MNARTLFLSALLFIAPAAGATEPAPDFTLPGQAGPVKLSDLRGKVVYLDFWASWCAPCRESFPWMNEVQRRYADQGLQIVAVNLDQEPELAARFLERTKPEFTIAYDAQGKTAESYQVQGMPSSYLIDREGRLHLRHIGFREQDREELEETLRAMLGKKTP